MSSETKNAERLGTYAGRPNMTKNNPKYIGFRT